MAKNILTPLSVWSDFKAETKFTVEEVEHKKSSNLIISSFYFYGKNRVKIFANMLRQEMLSMPAILLVGDGSAIDNHFAEMLAEKGYCVMVLDFKGKTAYKSHYTIYPDDMAFANYEDANIGEHKITCDIKSTCWYVWGAVVKNAVAFLRKQPYFQQLPSFFLPDGNVPHG